MNKYIQIEIAKALRKIGNHKCLAKAEILENDLSLMSMLSLRDLELNASDITSIMNCFKQEENHLSSISFSYNRLLGDLGVIDLLNNLPKSICELGLVDCGITDIGGIEILNWMKNSPKLQMICMEQNNFSEKLKLKFKIFSANKPQVLVVC